MTDIKFSGIRERNIKFSQKGYLFSRLLFTFSLIYSLSFAVGILTYFLLDFPLTETVNGYVAASFENIFVGCSSAGEYAVKLFSVSLSDIRVFICVFIAGFTMFSPFALSGIIIYRALSLGFSVGYLADALGGGVIETSHPALCFAVFIIANAISAALLISFASRSRMFADEFRALYGHPHKIIRSRELYRHIFLLLGSAGGVLLINLFRLLINSV